jgi:hypothetical protein
MQQKVYSIWIAVLFLGISTGYAQIKKQFSVEGHDEVDQIHLNFRVNNGICSIKAGEGEEAVTIYSNQDYNDYDHSFNKSINGNICSIDLDLQDKNGQGFTQSISRSVFGDRKDFSGKIWRVYLNQEKEYHLNLQYGLGRADIDLSGISVKNFNVQTASADIHVGYFSGVRNTIPMDTFNVKVDMGTIVVKKLNMARSKFVNADIGFGDLMLDLTGEPLEEGTIHGSVGAGNLFILLPEDQTPMIVHVHDSWLCKVKLSKGFRSIGNNTFVNESYAEDAENLLSFYLDVSMGNIVFREK